MHEQVNRPALLALLAFLVIGGLLLAPGWTGQTSFAAPMADGGDAYPPPPYPGPDEPSAEGTVTPEEGGSVATADGDFVAEFPAGSVEQPTTVRYRTLAAQAQALDTSLVAAFSFALEAETTGDGRTVSTFGSSYTMALRYSDRELASLSAGEASLNLAFWNGREWVKMMPCADCRLDTANNQVVVTANRTGRFALVGPQAGSSQYLPAVFR